MQPRPIQHEKETKTDEGDSLIESLPWIEVQFKVLASHTRLRVLISLARRGQPVNELALALGIERSSLSKHLSMLRREGWIKGRRFGKRIVYSLNQGVHIETGDQRFTIRRVTESGKILSLTLDNPLRSALRSPAFI